MTQPLEHPPQARRPHSAVLVVYDDLLVGIDADMAQRLREHRDRWQWVAAVGAGLGAGKIAVEVQEMCVGNVRRAVRAFPRIDIGKHVPGVDNDIVRVTAMRGEFGGGNEGRVGHG